jgi:hypothetical protein
VPDALPKTSLPIRAFDLARMLAGEEPATSSASHALGSVSWIIGKRELRKRSGSNLTSKMSHAARITAEFRSPEKRSNNPQSRRWLWRLVRHLG